VLDLPDRGDAVDGDAGLDGDLPAPVHLQHRVDDVGDDDALDLAQFLENPVELVSLSTKM